MAPRFLTITLRRLRASAPRAIEVVTIMGSISGVRPTATEMAKSSASSQLPLVMPLSTSTAGAITAMKRISSRDTAPRPLSKAVLGGLSPMVRAMEPKMVLLPTATTTARALPLMTVLPWKARHPMPVRAAAGSAEGAGDFSTGSLSPVRADCAMNRSRAERMRRSAGTISPAARRTMSPATSSSMGSSCRTPSRCTAAVVWIISDS